MFECLPLGIPIPLSLIHPRWLLKAPDVVVGWKMSINPSIGIDEYHNMTGEQDREDSRRGDNVEEDRARAQYSAPGAPPGTPPPTNPGGSPGGLAPAPTRPISLSDRFENRGRTLIETHAIEAFEFHQKIEDPAAAEEYAAEHAKLIKRLNTKHKQKHDEVEPLPKVFAHGGKDKDLKYKKGGSRRRAYTGREAAEAEEAEERRRRRHASIEATRIA